MSNELKGRIALVTGAAQGIGRAIVGLLAERGASVVVCDLDFDKAQEAAVSLTSQGLKALAVSANVAVAEEVKAVVQTVAAQWGEIDILVNNAGITRDTLLLRMKDEDWDAVLNVNLKGTYYCIKAVIPAMSKRRWGKIVNISSVVGVIGNPGQANYAASKAAVIGLTKTVAREYASRGINVNVVAPGFIETQMTAALSGEVREHLIKQIPLTRLGTPSDVAHAVAFLVSDEASYMTGQVLHVNGGMYMGG